jgi:hypothetical protein
MNAEASIPKSAIPSIASDRSECRRLERFRDPEITPFEVWDLVVGESLWTEQFYEPDFQQFLLKGIELLRAGRGTTRSKGPVPASVAGFDAVFLTGGRADTLDGVRKRPPTGFVFGAEGVYGGVSGGLHCLEWHGLSGWVIDLGQSQLKLATPNQRWVFQRDSTRLQANGEVRASAIPAQRRRLREFIALKLQLALTYARHSPQVLLAGLPARFDADGTPLGGNYAGLRGYRELIPDALALADLPDVPAFVVNDAELAAFAARADPRLVGFRKILVLTVGFGIGAALVSRGSADVPRHPALA